jgi:hypothetical protein
MNLTNIKGINALEEIIKLSEFAQKLIFISFLTDRIKHTINFFIKNFGFS